MMLPGYKEQAARLTPLGEIEWGDNCKCRNYREIAGHGVVDIGSRDKGWIPLICYEDLQPFYAQQARAEVASAAPNQFRLVDEGRPDAVILLNRPVDEILHSLPRATNKKRQLKRAMEELYVDSCQPSLRELPWKSSAIHLSAKYDGITMRSDMDDEWYIMPEAWMPNFKWVTVRKKDETQKLLGSAYFAVNESGSEWFWCGTVQSYEDPEPNEYAVGNVLLMLGMQRAADAGASVFNLGLDLFDYKPQMWGTVRKWDTGLEYVK